MARQPGGTHPRREDTANPRASRLAVLRILHAADVRQADVLEVLREALEHDESRDDDELAGAPLDRFAITLLHGIGATLPELDARIGRSARGWRVERMPVVDRNVLRLAIHELLTEVTPVAVVLDEAVRMASDLSTDDSGRYINSVLASIVRELEAEGRLGRSGHGHPEA